MFCVTGVMAGKLVDTVKNVSLHWGGGHAVLLLQKLGIQLFQITSKLEGQNWLCSGEN